MKTIALVGSEKLAFRLLAYVNESGFWTVSGMFDDYVPKGTLKYGYPILGKLDEIATAYKNGVFDEVLIAVGYNNFSFRKEIFKKMIKQDIPVATFIHPTANVSESATIGRGSVVLINCVVEMNTKIDPNVLLSSTSYVSHDVTIGAHSYCSAAMNIAGGSKIGECCFIGINSTIIDGITIGNDVFAAAGSVITKDVPSSVLVAGVPAQVKRTITK